MKLSALAMSTVAMLMLTVGCGVADENVTQDEQVTAQGVTCKTGQRLCPTCDGTGSYCATRCFECAPQVVANPDPSAKGTTSCPPRQFLCQRCDGSYQCAPECAPCL